MSALDVVIRFIGDAGKAIQSAKDVDSAYQQTANKMIKSGLVMSGAITAPLLLAAKSAAGELANAERVAAQTRAVIASTGGEANVTAKNVQDLATAIARKTGYDDEAVASGANLLLTFRNIHNEAGKGNDIFNQSVNAAADLSAAWGIDIPQAATKIGKALNDPIAGMTALSRVGITFSQQQKNVIRDLTNTGDIMGAQKVILKELETQVGGSAAAYGDTLSGKVNKARETFMNASATLIGVAAPGIQLVADTVQTLSDFLQGLPAPIQQAVGLLLILAAAAGPLSTLTGVLMKIGPHVISAFEGVAPMIGQIGAAITTASASTIALTGGLVLAAGALVGFVAWMGLSKSSAEAANEAGKKWAQTQIENANQAKDHAVALGELQTKQNIVKESLNELIATRDAYAAVTTSNYEAERQFGITADEARQRVNEMTVQIEGLKGKKEGLAEGIRQAKRELELEQIATEAQRAALDQLANSTFGVATATQTQIQAVQQLNNAYLAAQGGEVGYQAAQLQVEAAQNRVNEAVAKFGPDSLEAREAANSLAQAKLSAANAAFTLQASEGELANILKTQGVGGLIALRDSLVQTIQKHGDATGAVQAQVDKINDLINRTNAAGQAHGTATVDANTEPAHRKLDTFEAAANVATRTRTAVIDIVTTGLSGLRELRGYATGGIVPGPIGSPQLAIVHGGEEIIPVGKTAASMSGGSGVVIINQYDVTVQVPPNADLTAVGAATIDAIRDYERLNGASWRKQ